MIPDGVGVHIYLNARVSYLGLELQRLPDQLHLLPALVLLHHGEAEGELRHLQSPSPPETRHLLFVLGQECQKITGQLIPGYHGTRMTSFLQRGQCPIRSWGGLEGRGCRAEILLPAIKPNCLKRRKLREEQMERFTKMSTTAEEKAKIHSFTQFLRLQQRILLLVQLLRGD